MNIFHVTQGGDQVYQVRTQPDIVTLADPELLSQNLVELKHHKLARALRSGLSDKDLKPNAAVRDQLNVSVKFSLNKCQISSYK